MQEIIFGPILSRRFGISLGVDLSPQKKQCNFDCLYCELGGAKTQEGMQEVLPLQDVLEAIKEAMRKNPKVDVLTITANGEPTLYPHFLSLAKELKALTYNHCKTLILSNGSRFGETSVQEGLREFDIVKFSLDCVSEKIFKKIDRPNKALKLEEILEGIARFASTYQGELVCEVLVLEKLNDTKEEIQKIADFTKELGVARIDLGSLDRPPAYAIKGVSEERLQELASAFEGQCVSIPLRKKQEFETKSKLSSSAEVLKLLLRRPISVDEAPLLFDKRSVELIKQMVQKEEICLKNAANMAFYTLRS